MKRNRTAEKMNPKRKRSKGASGSGQHLRRRQPKEQPEPAGQGSGADKPAFRCAGAEIGGKKQRI